MTEATEFLKWLNFPADNRDARFHIKYEINNYYKLLSGNVASGGCARTNRRQKTKEKVLSDPDVFPDQRGCKVFVNCLCFSIIEHPLGSSGIYLWMVCFCIPWRGRGCGGWKYPLSIRPAVRVVSTIVLKMGVVPTFISVCGYISAS